MKSDPHVINRPRETTFDMGLRVHLQRVYNMMAMGLVLTGVLAYAVASTPALAQIFLGNQIMFLIVAFAPLGIIFFGLTPAKVSRMAVGKVMGLYLLMTGLIGISMSSIFLVYEMGSIARVFFITAGMFSATSIYGYTTKKDLSGMGSLMMMGLIGIIIASVVNMFMHSSMMEFAISVIGVVIFTGLTAWDTQRIKQSYSADHGHESNMKMAIMGALSLYLNFINLFMMLLRLFGDRR